VSVDAVHVTMTITCRSGRVWRVLENLHRRQHHDHENAVLPTTTTTTTTTTTIPLDL